MISILFLAADPTNMARRRQGEESREIEDQIKLSQFRDRYIFHQRMAVRPRDLTQLLLDINPEIVHFSGHGESSGELALEDDAGNIRPVTPDTLAALFEQFSNQVKCVVLNACYSELQAKAIAAHIPYVIGMQQNVSNRAAIAFAIGFYQALGASRTLEVAYQLGCLQIRLHSIPEHLTPILIKGEKYSQDLNHGDDLTLSATYNSILTNHELMNNQWVKCGLTTEVVGTLTIDPDNREVLYIGRQKSESSEYSFYKSVDGGSVWSVSKIDIVSDASINCIHIAQATKWIHVGTESGVFIGKEKGKSWQIDDRHKDLEVRAIASYGNTILYGTGKATSGVFSRQDESTQVDSSENGSISAESNDPSTGDLHISFDDGVSFCTAPIRNINSISISFVDNFVIYFGTSDNGIYRSLNGGNTIEPAGLIEAKHVFCVSASPNSVYDVLAGTDAGLFISSDGGDTWRRIEQVVNEEIKCIEWSKTNHQWIYVGTQSGVYLSRDAGHSWQLINKGLIHLWVNSLATTSEGLIYCGTGGGGVYKKNEKQISWESTNLGLEGRCACTSLAVFANDVIFVGTVYGVYRSINGGISWQQMSYFLTGDFHTRQDTVWSIALSPQSSIEPKQGRDDLYISRDHGISSQNSSNTRVGPIYAGTQKGNIYKSIDNGSSWQLLTNLHNSRLSSIVVSHHPYVIFAATEGGGIFKSENGGLSWKVINANLQDKVVTSLSLVEDRSLSLYAGTKTGQFYESINAGQTWKLKSEGLSKNPIFSIVSGKQTHGLIYVAMENGGVYKSFDGGNSWIEKNKGLTTLRAYAIVMVDNKDSHLLLGTDQGVFESFDGAGSWHRFTNGIVDSDIVNMIAISPSHPNLVYTVTTSGIYKTLLKSS